MACPNCNAVFYENPRILVSTMVRCEERLLLCSRAHAPSIGKWNPPSGFLERDETLEEAAARETFEETGVIVPPEDLHLYTVTSLSKISEIYICFRAAITSDACRAGPEAFEARFFAERDIPWNGLAFPEMGGFLRLYFRELAKGAFGIHLSRVDKFGRFRREYRLATDS
jgi:ADP-ribose pyrophosphatase YjhB (NUDIX family)